MAFPSAPSAAKYLEHQSSAITTDRAGQVSDSDRVFDTTSGVWDGWCVFDISAIDATDGDEQYIFRIELSNDNTFATGVQEFNSVSALSTGQQALIVSNTINSVSYRYIRLKVEVSGTTPSINLDSWLIHESDLDSMSLPQLTRLMAISVNRFSEASAEMRLWANGSVDGGPYSDGRYPLSDGNGNTDLVDCPAKIAATAAGTLTKDSVRSLPEETNPLLDPADPAPEIIGIVNPGTAGEESRRFPIDLFASRRTRDLNTFNTLIGDELIPAMNASTGLDGRIAISELIRTTTGIIDPTAPPYNCVFDARFLKASLPNDYRGHDPSGLQAGDPLGALTTAGSTRIQIEEALFRDTDVGLTIQLSNGAGDGGALKTTIASYVSPYEVDLAVAAGNSARNDTLWGTDNTAGMQAALDDAGSESLFNYGGVVLMPAGACLTGSLRYKARCGIFGRGVRQTTLYRLDDDAKAWAWFEFQQQITNDNTSPYFGAFKDDYPEGVPGVAEPQQPAGLLRNYRMMDTDFLAMGDFAINGARFCQRTAYRGLEYIAPPGYINTPQTDPYPMISRMHISNTGDDGIMHYGRHSGSMFGVEIINAGNIGLYLRGYDANMTNILIIACDAMGLYIPEEGANNNFLNLKASFNGFNGHNSYLWNEFGPKMQTNVCIMGDTQNITNMRAQETLGSNLWVGGNGNQFGDCGLDDTGCIAYKHGGDTNALPIVRAAIVIEDWTGNGSGGRDNRFNDVGYGPAVHPGENYATHGVFFLGRLQNDDDVMMPQNNSGRIYTKSVGTYFTSDTSGKTTMSKFPGVNFPWGSNFDASATFDEPVPGVTDAMAERSWFYNGTSPTNSGETKAVINATIPANNLMYVDNTPIQNF